MLAEIFMLQLEAEARTTTAAPDSVAMRLPYHLMRWVATKATQLLSPTRP